MGWYIVSIRFNSFNFFIIFPLALTAVIGYTLLRPMQKENWSLTSAGMALRDAIARQRAAPSTRHRPERAKPRCTGRMGVSPVQGPEPRSWVSPKGPQQVRNSVSSL